MVKYKGWIIAGVVLVVLMIGFAIWASASSGNSQPPQYNPNNPNPNSSTGGGLSDILGFFAGLFKNKNSGGGPIHISGGGVPAGTCYNADTDSYYAC